MLVEKALSAVQVIAGVAVLQAAVLLPCLLAGSQDWSLRLFILLSILAGYVFAGLVGGAWARHPVQQAVLVGLLGCLVSGVWTRLESSSEYIDDEVFTCAGALIQCLLTATGGLLAAKFTPYQPFSDRQPPPPAGCGPIS